MTRDLHASPIGLMTAGSKYLDGCLFGRESCCETCGGNHRRPTTRGDLVLGEDAPKVAVTKMSHAVGHLVHFYNIRTDTYSRICAH
jgi:hypothetical protein